MSQVISRIEECFAIVYRDRDFVVVSDPLIKLRMKTSASFVFIDIE